MISHFIYCGTQYTWNLNCDTWLPDILEKQMKKYNIKEAILTKLEMQRLNLVTKEVVKKAYKGELKSDDDWEDRISLTDDLETFFFSLQTTEDVFEDEEEVDTFFTPKLTEEELVLIHQKDEKYLKSFFDSKPDVKVEEMAKSSSKSKYVHANCSRKTIPLPHIENLTISSEVLDKIHFEGKLKIPIGESAFACCTEDQLSNLFNGKSFE